MSMMNSKISITAGKRVIYGILLGMVLWLIVNTLTGIYDNNPKSHNTPLPTVTCTTVSYTPTPHTTPTHTTKYVQLSNRSDVRGVPRKMNVTAYDLSYESCGKYPSHPEYGITTSGNRVREWCTVAAGPGIPFGTRIYIPYFDDMPNHGIFIVQDRGGAVKDNCIDVYMSSHEACMRFGRKSLDVYILE